ncbi:GNAT family N-acetyltransferase [Parabacteroides sp. PF5-9]|uniref:GNAT family N-acetyltransferase n=1 Tax=Parabacteroides sp. PF5-9 TaxID=1742404 RepID=UPI0024761252|nr:GNAT family N-acetyltransferase [Parabacteroides sp. PF5-9]MDH6359066.1 hypothetical protein [Parabacteroides sp. PF5-9]
MPTLASSSNEPLIGCQFNKAAYRTFCSTEKSIPLFSQDWWLDIVCGEANWEVLLIEQEGRMQAALPLYIPYQKVVSMPWFTQTMGPWFAPETEDTKYATGLGRRQQLCKVFIEALKAYPYFFQQFHYTVTDWLPFYWAGFQQTTRYTYLLNDLSDPDRLWGEMSQQTRRNITKAREKYHITVRKGVPVEDFLKINQQSFERQQITSLPNKEILTSLITTTRERQQGDIWGGYDAEGRLHAAVFMVWQESTAYYIAGGGDSVLRGSGAHSLVMWECIRYASQVSGRFDFEGSMLPGVERFFREFGGIQTPYFAITKGKLSLLHKGWLKLKRLF